jgi:hypothetical protein
LKNLNEHLVVFLIQFLRDKVVLNDEQPKNKINLFFNLLKKTENLTRLTGFPAALSESTAT